MHHTSASFGVVPFAVGGRIGDGPVFVKYCRAPGFMESFRSRSRSDAWVAMRGDVWEVGGIGIGRDLAASEIRQDCCQGIENEVHGVRGRGLKCEVIK